VNNYTKLAFHVIKAGSLLDQITTNAINSLPGKEHSVSDAVEEIIPTEVMDVLKLINNNKLLKAILMGAGKHIIDQQQQK